MSSAGAAGTGGRPASRSERVRREILEAAVGVLLADPGASMQAVAEAAGVSRATLHRHFTGRQDLMREIALDALAECEAAVVGARLEEGVVEEALRRLVDGLVPIGERFQFLLYNVLYNAQLTEDPEFAAADARVLEPVGELIERGKRDGTFRAEVPAAWIGDALEALIYAAWLSTRDGKIARRDAPGLVTSTLLGGLGERK